MKRKNTFKNRAVVLLIVAFTSFSFQSCIDWRMKQEHKKHMDETQKNREGNTTDNKFFIDCYDCVPVQCVQNGCANPYCQATIRDCHEITGGDVEFQNKIIQFTGGKIPAPKAFSADDIRDVLQSADCNSEYIFQVCADHSIIDNNSDIIINSIPINQPSGICDDELDVLKHLSKDDYIKAAKYSRAFFLGVLQLNPDSFYFYKAISKRRVPNQGCAEIDKYDIIFKAVEYESDGTTIKSVFYGNASDLLP